MKDLKAALLKAGLKQSKSENERERMPKKQAKKESVSHQLARNFCEECNRTLPDVERYAHRNPTTKAQWICVQCADRLMISDDSRNSNQSDFAKNGTFRREFGHTKKFIAGGGEYRSKDAKKSSRSDKDGNQGSRGNKGQRGNR